MAGKFKESDIRADDILNTYLDLSARDAQTFFASPELLKPRSCPGCGQDGSDHRYRKNGFGIDQCRACATLYVNPAPSVAQLDNLYRDSESSRYWARVFFPSVAAARRIHIFKPRAERFLKFAGEHGLDLRSIVDVGAGAGLFLEELGALAPHVTCRAVEPGEDFATALRRKGIEVYQGFLETLAETGDWNDRADAAVSFEVIEHLAAPQAYFNALARLVRPGGIVLISGLCGDGFDIQMLGATANAVSPPHHLTFLSRAGVEHLVAQAGLEMVWFETPGQLDVEIVVKALAKNPDAVRDPFMKHLLTRADDAARGAFQDFLSANGLSSHMWIFARRPD